MTEELAITRRNALNLQREIDGKLADIPARPGDVGVVARRPYHTATIDLRRRRRSHDDRGFWRSRGHTGRRRASSERSMQDVSRQVGDAEQARQAFAGARLRPVRSRACGWSASIKVTRLPCRADWLARCNASVISPPPLLSRIFCSIV